MDFINAEFFGDRFAYRTGISSQHDRADSSGFQSGDCGLRISFDGISDQDVSRILFIHSDMHNRTGFMSRRMCNTEFLHHFNIADKDFLPINDDLQTVTRYIICGSNPLFSYRFPVSILD